MKKLKAIDYIIIALLCLIVLFVGFSYIKSEILSVKYEPQLGKLYLDTGLAVEADEVATYKVLDIHKDTASVFFRFRDKIGIVVEATKKDNVWSYSGYYTVYSEHGSCDFKWFWPIYY